MLPYLGVFVYLIVRGHSMGERAMRQAQAREQANQEYIRTVATSSTSSADEIAKAAALRDSGAISEEEYAALKAKLLG